MTVGVGIKISDGCTISTVNHVIDQLLLIIKTVDRVLILNGPGDRFIKNHRVNAVAVWVSHGVVDVVCTPSAPRSCDKHVVKFRGAGHVNVERGLGLGAPSEEGDCRERKQMFHEMYLFVFNSNSVVWSFTRRPNVPGSTT